MELNCKMDIKYGYDDIYITIVNHSLLPLQFVSYFLHATGDAEDSEILVFNDRQFAVEPCLSTDSRAKRFHLCGCYRNLQNTKLATIYDIIVLWGVVFDTVQWLELFKEN